MKASLQINSVIICDDIRKEDNGKVIFIGVYSGDILVTKLPALLKLCYWLSGETTQINSEFEVEITLQKKSDGSSVELFKNIIENHIKDDIDPGKGKEFHVALIDMPVSIEEDSILVVRWRTIKGKWKVLTQKGVYIQT